jgi:hypothetical protein
MPGRGRGGGLLLARVGRRAWGTVCVPPLPLLLSLLFLLVALSLLPFQLYCCIAYVVHFIYFCSFLCLAANRKSFLDDSFRPNLLRCHLSITYPARLLLLQPCSQ